MTRAPIFESDSLVCGHDVPILGPLDLEIAPGEFVLIEGPNGIGKTTFLETSVGLLEPLEGSYQWSIPRERRRFVPQVRTLDAILPATVADVVATGAQHGSGFASLRADFESDELETVLEEVGMEHRTADLFRELSEGQKQLVLLARALAGDPRALVLDEPTASMDPERERAAIDLLDEKRREEGLTVLIIAHGSRRAREVATECIEIDRNREVTHRPADST